MLFNSFLFIFVFLPITLAGFLVVGKLVEVPAARIAWLAAASLAFYAYWNVNFLPVIAISIVVNFAFAFVIAKLKRCARLFLFVAVVANLAGLAFYKYVNFGIEIFNGITAQHVAPLSIALPLGISFFTFTQIAYLVDVAIGRAYEGNFLKYVLFVTYFPHLIAGPIMHHREMMPQFGAGKACLPLDRLAIGLTIFSIGLFKKAVIADCFATISDPVFATATKGSVSSLEAWCGALAYSLQIYFDFSGYCDMAIGVSLLFGVVLPFNFDAPYKSHSIAEFWRRWHITLSRFLRDYVYIPLGGNRHGEPRRVLNLVATMLIGGLWHGAGWTFVIWGGLHGLFLIVNHSWERLQKRSSFLARLAEGPAYGLICLALTQICIVVAWVFFRSDTLTTARVMLSAMFGRERLSLMLHGYWSWADFSRIDFALVVAGYAACLIFPNINEMFREVGVGLDSYHLPSRWSILRVWWHMNFRWGAATAVLFAVALIAILASFGGSPFLYFQF